MFSKAFEFGAFSNSGLVWYFVVYDLCLIVYFSYLHAFIHLLLPKLVVQTGSIYENKVKKENKSLQICYLTMRLHISQTIYTAIQQVSRSKFVFTHDHGVSNVIDSTQFNALRGDFRSIGIKSFPSR